eukprot:9382868-Pyramimonas_sp.AAC.2
MVHTMPNARSGRNDDTVVLIASATSKLASRLSNHTIEWSYSRPAQLPILAPHDHFPPSPHRGTSPLAHTPRGHAQCTHSPSVSLAARSARPHRLHQ